MKKINYILAAVIIIPTVSLDNIKMFNTLIFFLIKFALLLILYIIVNLSHLNYYYSH